MSDEKRPNLFPAGDIEGKRREFRHPWNPKSLIRWTWLSRMAGLKRTGVGLVHLPPGHESFCYHAHHGEEEWVYILSGRGLSRIDGEEREVGPGDFLAFPTPSVPHQLANPFDEDLVYLMGGESLPNEVVDFPDLDRRMVRTGYDIQVHRLSEAEPFRYS